MELNDYLERIRKSNCPQDCDFTFKERIEIALVPPPDEIWGIVISQDPTVDWWLIYKYLKNENGNTRRKMLFASAIPVSLFIKVLRFMEGDITKDIGRKFFNVIIRKGYWTHLHKCFTDAKNVPFKKGNAEKCANKWLEEELEYAIGNKTRFIIALGKPVQSWVQNWEEGKNKGIEIINLPHPSGQNNPIWYRSQKDRYKERIEETERQIRRLVELCKRD